MNRSSHSNNNRQIAWWLLAVCALVFAMVVLGGVTRLTHSGLSIVEWQPLMGAIPPLSESDWLALFEKYKLTPEYQKVNLGMSLEEFSGNHLVQDAIVDGVVHAGTVEGDRGASIPFLVFDILKLEFFAGLADESSLVHEIRLR